MEEHRAKATMVFHRPRSGGSMEKIVPKGDFFHLKDLSHKSITIMKKYTKTKVIRISEIQLKTLQKMKSYNVDVGNFIRDAIAEKIKREYINLLPKPKKQYCPFSNNTIEL